MDADEALELLKLSKYKKRNFQQSVRYNYLNNRDRKCKELNKENLGISKNKNSAKFLYVESSTPSTLLTKKKSQEILSYKPLPFQVAAEPKKVASDNKSLKRIASLTPISDQTSLHKVRIDSSPNNSGNLLGTTSVKNLNGIFHEQRYICLIFRLRLRPRLYHPLSLLM